MTELPFASFCNRFAGRTGWVIGRGPTRFRYESLRDCEGPVFFVNDSVSQEPWLRRGIPSFFFAHDASMECWLLDPRRRAVPVMVADQPLTGPADARVRGLISGAADPRLASVASGVLYTKYGMISRECLLGRTREEIREAGQLYTSNGTIIPLLHFAWYVGCTSLNLVGCDGFAGVGYDERLENRSGSVQVNATNIRVKQDEVLDRLSLPRSYLGTIPHRVTMIMEIRVDRARHEGFLAWVEKLVWRVRDAGCDGVAVTDSVGRSGSFWINGTWPTIESCSRCLGSDAYAKAVLGGVPFLARDPATAFKVAFRAVPAEGAVVAQTPMHMNRGAGR